VDCGDDRGFNQPAFFSGKNIIFSVLAGNKKNTEKFDWNKQNIRGGNLQNVIIRRL